MSAQDRRPKVELYLTEPTVEGLAALYECLTGSSLSPESMEDLKKVIDRKEGNSMDMLIGGCDGRADLGRERLST